LYSLGQTIGERPKIRRLEGMDQDSERIWILKSSNCSGVLLARPEGKKKDWKTKND
jgi:hypothetical protein